MKGYILIVNIGNFWEGNVKGNYNFLVYIFLYICFFYNKYVFMD